MRAEPTFLSWFVFHRYSVADSIVIMWVAFALRDDRIGLAAAIAVGGMIVSGLLEGWNTRAPTGEESE